MRIAHFDAFSGISGDMTVGALIDAGVPADELFAALESLGTGARFSAAKTVRGGLAATKFDVAHGDQRSHRHLPQILKILEGSALPESAKENASRIFTRLAEAEAAVHGTTVEKVHFHEVGAVDSICDIAGACTALAMLGIGRVTCSAVNLGSGTVQTQHGVMPVPAPATAALLAGRPIYARGPAAELTTPTGAAIAAVLAADFGAPPAMRLGASGYGAGSKDFAGHANVLRVLTGEAAGVPEAMEVAVLEANIDDSSPQVLAFAVERLHAAGALDATLTPMLMKKGRPGSLLRVIARPEDRERLAAAIFAETSTLGLRIHSAERRVLERRVVSVETEFGIVPVKASEHGFAPEYEDCRRIALEKGVPLKQVLAAATAAYLRNR